mgnify:CR=1 FL=1|jgi:hypothetical protein
MGSAIMKFFYKIKKILINTLSEAKIFIVGNFQSYRYSFNDKLLERNEILLNKYNGKRIFIFFSGRSINSINLSSFKDEYTMGINFLAVHPEFSKINADFYCFTGSWSGSVSKLLAWSLHVVYTSIERKTKLILDSSSFYWINNFDYYGLKNYVGQNPVFFINRDKFIISSKNGTNCNLPVSIHGVFSRSIGVAVDMGFKEIYLVGADYTKTPLRVGHCYGSESFIEDPTEQLKSSHKKIKAFAEANEVSIINIIDTNQTSNIFNSIDVKEVYEIL